MRRRIMPTPEDNRKEIPKNYDPGQWEERLYQKWLASGCFRPAESGTETFSMVLPPPNVTGHLHLGHSAMVALQDIMTRVSRMQGRRTLWLPGTDHAAIATQSKVESLLHQETGQTRHDLGREAFLQRVEAFAQASHDTIVNQVKKLGASVDWSREAYTLDEKRSLAVRTAFKTMSDLGLIYRGYRVVNWSVRGQSTLSDDEVVHVERQATLYTFRYWEDFPIPIATTRPETKLGDTAVAVHPDDKRYKQYIGQEFSGVFCGVSLKIKIIGDTAVDPEFGTGAVGVTPAHSHTDYDIWLRHKDEMAFGPDGKPVIGQDGRMSDLNTGDFSGLTTLEAREKIIASLEAAGLIEKTEDITQNVGMSDRYGDVVEALPLLQWFVAVDCEFEHRTKGRTTLKKLMREAVASGQINVLPERFEKTYFHWIDNLRDWCISRQIWYGHRIPVWYRDEEVFVGLEAPADKGWIQDPDTLDTWFSSGLWTFSTLGWPDEKEFETNRAFHPTTVLETGYDILFFWVARMILMSECLLGEVPFRTVYLHGLVRDEQGRKMSKSLGNIIDPLDIIAEYGADALRLSLVLGSTPGQDIRLGQEKIASYRNFVNKLWNIGRYVLTNSRPPATDSGPEPKTAADRWVLARLDETIGIVTDHLERYNFSLAGETLRDFTWNEFADWYVEIHKIEKNDVVLRYVFKTLLRLWHPFTPFVTEALWEQSDAKESLLAVGPWPVTENFTTDSGAKDAFREVLELITRIRAIRSGYRIDPTTSIPAIIGSETGQSLADYITIIERLARVTFETKNEERTDVTVPIIAGAFTLSLRLGELLDIEAEKKRLAKEITNKQQYAETLEKRLSDPAFLSKAPETLVANTHELLETAKRESGTLERLLANLG